VHHGDELIVLGALFVIAWVLGRLGKRIGLPAIPIYMVVGLLASPHFTWFPLEFEAADVELIAIFGLILLLFNLGLEFDQDEFFGNAGRLVVSGGTYILVNMAVGFAFGFMVGWGTREALVIAGMTATSSSAIVTKLLIELRRLDEPETPMILGVTVVEDIFIAIYLAIVSVVLSGESDPLPVIGRLAVSFLFLAAMFTLARFGGRLVSRLVQTKDDELFTVLFFGLAVAFGGIGDLLGVTDAIGAFLIGLVLGATRFRARIETIARPLRDVFGAFFFLNFGLALDPSTFGAVLLPVGLAILMTVTLNAIAGQLVARMNRLGGRAGVNTAAILVNRGEFALILATLAASAGLDERLTPFAGLYVLVMAVLGPVLAVNAPRIGRAIFRDRPKAARRTDPERDRALALAEAAMADDEAAEADVARSAAEAGLRPAAPGPGSRRGDEADEPDEAHARPAEAAPPRLDPDVALADDDEPWELELADRERTAQAAEQGDADGIVVRRRERDPEY
jgi:monovalent cation:H+ antiporter-2, CPA2 family